MSAQDQYRENLALYAVGALSGEEAAQVKRHLSECSACREELSSLSEAAAQIALVVNPVAPAARVREKLLARMGDQDSEIFARLGDERSTRRPRAQSAWFWVPAFAAAILAVVLVALWRQDRELLRERQDLAANLETNGRALDRDRALIDTLTARDAVHVALAAAGAKPQPGAKAVYSPQKRGLVLLASNLNLLPLHKAYELWLLPANGAQPIPAGTFRPDARGSATLVLSQFGSGVTAKGFAITIESEAGSAAPTMPIILSGTT
ncbi:MAG: anti-sigma factor [Candidatus Acidiferrum sp.]